MQKNFFFKHSSRYWKNFTCISDLKGYIISSNRRKNTKNGSNMKKILLLLTLFQLLALGAALPRCASCGKKCQRYLKTQENIYCSDVCLPQKYKCSLCKQPFNGRNYIFTDLHGNTFRYCEICFNRPKCASCGNPLKTVSRIPDSP